MSEWESFRGWRVAENPSVHVNEYIKVQMLPLNFSSPFNSVEYLNAVEYVKPYGYAFFVFSLDRQENKIIPDKSVQNNILMEMPAKSC